MFYKDLYDDQYDNYGFTHTRNTVRAILVDENKQIGMLHIVGEDYFGIRNHYETPGGGVELKEDFKTALKREILEETGHLSSVDMYLGMIVSRYNLIKRITVSRFYLCSLKTKETTQRTEEEQLLIKSIEFRSLDTWLDILNNAENRVDKLVHEREIYVLEYLKENRTKYDL